MLGFVSQNAFDDYRIHTRDSGVNGAILYRGPYTRVDENLTSVFTPLRGEMERVIMRQYCLPTRTRWIEITGEQRVGFELIGPRLNPEHGLVRLLLLLEIEALRHVIEFQNARAYNCFFERFDCYIKNRREIGHLDTIDSASVLKSCLSTSPSLQQWLMPL